MKKGAHLPQDRLGFIGLSLHAIREWRLLLLASLSLLLIGLVAWQRIPRFEDPQIERPVLSVTVPYPGASAEDVEVQVAKPIEEELFGMEGVEFIESKSFPNYAQISMRFADGTAMETTTETVRGKVLGKRKDLPAEVREPTVYRSKLSTDFANMLVVVTGRRADGVLTDAAKDLKTVLSSVSGVSTVTLRGERTRAVRIRVDPARLVHHRLSVDDVVRQIKLANVRIAAGELRVGAVATLLSLNNELKDAASVARIPISAAPEPSGGARTVSLGDIAEIKDDFRTAPERMIQNGAPAVGLEIRFRPNENAVEVGKRVRDALDGARPRMPPGAEIAIVHDQPRWVESSLASFTHSLFEGIVLVMLVITLGMGWRAAVVVVMVLPLAIAGSIVGLYAFGFALDQVSIAGLIVALGLLVDDAVVVTESVQLIRDRGLSGLRAAVVGTARVFWANNGTTAVACASFIPLFIMGGDVGRFVRGLPVAVVLALVTSLLVAQLLTPWISTFFLKAPRGVRPISDLAPFNREEDSAGTHHDEQNIVLRTIKAGYTRIIPSVVEHPYRVIGVATVLLAGALLLLPKVGIQFFPKSDKPVLFVNVELPRGTSQIGTTQKVLQVSDVLGKDPAVQSTSAMVGGAFPFVFLGRGRHPQSKDFGDVLVRLNEPATDEVTQRLRAALADIPGARISIDELYNGPPVNHPIAIRIQGDDRDKLQAYAEQIKAKLRAIPGTLNVNDSLSDTIPVVDIAVDPDRALRLGLTPAQIGSTLRAVYGEDKITSFRQDGETIELVLEDAQTAERPLAEMGQTRVPTAGKGAAPVLAVADVTLKRKFAELRRRDTRPIVEVTADVNGAVLPSSVLAQLKPAVSAMGWEAGYGVVYGGEKAETEKSFKNLAVAGVLTLALIFVLLVSMFRSLVRAVVVIAAVPFALIGAVGGLYLTNNAFGFMAFLGLIALIGVYINHKIYFVDRVHELVHRGVTWQAAMHQAGIDRLRPVVLTALTAILGLLPLTLGGGSFWSAFGWVNIFGLATSIPLSLLLLPALLVLSYRFEGRRPALLGFVDGDTAAQEKTLVMVPQPAARRASSPPQDCFEAPTTVYASTAKGSSGRSSGRRSGG